MFKLAVQLIVSGADRHPERGMRSYYQYLEHLYNNREAPDSVEQFAKGYEDYLQCPLQVRNAPALNLKLFSFLKVVTTSNIL